MPLVHVAVAVLRNAAGQILIQQRAADSHQGGLWEFPGGKLEAGESLSQALTREIHEELGIRVLAHQPLIQIRHDYGDRHVLLDVHLVNQWQGEVSAMEQQPLHWAEPDKLVEFDMPAADRPIVTALQLPCSYVITPPVVNDAEDLLQRLQQLLQQGESLFLYRVKRLAGSSHEALIERMRKFCQPYAARLIVHGEVVANAVADGMHLTENMLAGLSSRPIEAEKLLSTSCHTAESLQKAQAIGADFALLSPVAATSSHPDRLPLGWERFAEQVTLCNIPVYALGGMTKAECDLARQHGGQGVAGISSWWGADDASA
ncbi:MAG: Nudix family hydrolase [Chromatiales bacterium]|jgi:8-oxo-dGTP diphosphatase